MENIPLCARVGTSFIQSKLLSCALKTTPRYLNFWTISTLLFAEESASDYIYVKHHNYCFVFLDTLDATFFYNRVTHFVNINFNFQATQLYLVCYRHKETLVA